MRGSHLAEPKVLLRVKVRLKFFWAFFSTKLLSRNCEATFKRTKKNRTKLDIKILRPSPQQEVLYVSAFGGEIKKKHSPTLKFEVNFVSRSLFE